MIDDIHVRDVLLDSGVSHECAEAVQKAYREETKDSPIAVSNLVENKTTISLAGVTVSIGKEATGKVRTQLGNGRRYLLIDLDDPSVQINGLTARITDAPVEEEPALAAEEAEESAEETEA